ncbi:thioredoxin domain-containing protein [Aestuariivivens insulae]|uniref:thioredoxin domain-containing protein n=1 Tax=Aestuariivivens insulae TaxID=1621988 RepID=UPI001F58570A|nr:thioredoxin domain-containing protein [Aestuariivivens insulae]
MPKFKFYNIFIVVLFLSCCKNGGGQKREYTNSLINETSPYLLQHAHNPVDWRIWSDDALEEAKNNNKLVIISIGYSSCHWCHVMERETFENEEIAKVMNKNFINIKIDREERPDIDHLYQVAVQLFRGSSGWPLNVVALPNGKPIYGGTYHTKEQWTKVLNELYKIYTEDPEKLEEYAENLASGIQEVNLIKPSNDFERLSKDSLIESIESWKLKWDKEMGGEDVIEKFINPVNLEFLLDYAILTNDEQSKSHLKLTLDKIALGGIYDHVGGGFFRYSTDDQWKVPHFEKMLYDNAQIIGLYSKAYKVFKEPIYKEIVMETFGFLEREMKYHGGGYYSSIDAESEGEEGKYYEWTEEELKSILKEDFQLFARYFNVNSRQALGNGKFILFKILNDSVFIKENSISKADIDSYRVKWKKLLLNKREQRIRPNMDDKVIISWNALLINGLLEGYEAFGSEVFLNRAKTIFDFINSKNISKNRLIHSYKKGGRNVEGFVEDYAFMTSAALKLYYSTLDVKYLNASLGYTQVLNEEFLDNASGMYKYNQDSELISMVIKTDDGAMPSPNSVIAHNLFELGHIQYDEESLKRSKVMLSTMVPMTKEYARNYSKWNSLWLKHAYPYYEVAVVGEKALNKINNFAKIYIPNVLLVGSTIESNLPLFNQRYVDKDTYIYVCQNRSCKLPVKTVEEALVQLENF